MKKHDVFQPDIEWLEITIAGIIRRAKKQGITESEIERGEINCGSCGCIGAVILKTGERIEV